jgi:hypothetical protein
MSSLGFVSEIRVMAGLDLPEIAAEHPVELLLLECLRDYFPLLLMCAGSGAFKTVHFDGLPPCGLLPSGRQALDEILRDPQLRRLFPGSGEPSSKDNRSRIASFVHWLSGRAHVVSLDGMPDALVWETIYLAYIQGVNTFEGCAEILRALLSVARSLATGAPTEVPAVVALANIRLDQAVSHVDLGRSKIYPGRIGIAFRLINDDFLSSGALMLTSRMDRITRITALPDGGHPDEVFAGNMDEVDLSESHLMREIERVRLALLLSTIDFPIAPIPSSGTHINPLMKDLSVSIFFDVPKQSAMPLIVLLTEDSARSAAHWHSVLDQGKLDTVAIGVRRLLSAVAMRTSTVDAFINTVLFWENLFGEAIETSFKVCGALAWLIHPDDENARKTTYRNLKRLYGVRSSVVHGSKDITESEAQQYCTQAIRLSISAMRAAVSHPDLLALKDSNKRYLLMLMGFRG